MSKILLTALTTAVLATSGFAAENDKEISGTMPLEKGATFQISKEDYKVTKDGSITLSRYNDNADKPQIIIDSGKKLKVVGGTIKDSGSEALLGQIILNGTLLLENDNSGEDPVYPSLICVDIKNGDNKGLLDMSSVRKLPMKEGEEIDKTTISNNLARYQNPDDNSDSINNIDANGIDVKLPFNTVFYNINLSSANSVEYTYLSKKDVVATQKEHIVENNENSPAGKLIQKDPNGTTYGDYGKGDLGVGLPTNNVNAIECNLSGQMTFESVMNGKDAGNDNTSYNSQGYYLKTNDLDDDGTKHEVPYDNTKEVQNYDTTYNFGFCGSTPITISLAAGAGENAIESAKAIFKGDNQYYVPEDTQVVEGNTVAKDGITLSKDVEGNSVYTPVEFAGNNSLFPFNQTYGKGTFTAGTGEAPLSNTLPAGKIAEFKEGFTLGANHTLIVKGTLIG